MERRVLDKIYDAVIYPSEELQNLILAAEAQMREKSRDLEVSDEIKEKLLDLFVESEQEVRKGVFSIGARIGAEIMLGSRKDDSAHLEGIGDILTYETKIE